jgi:hypothetical protein
LPPTPTYLRTSERCADFPKHIVTYSGFVWLKRRVLDLIIEFIGPLYNWLQQFTNHWHTVICFVWTVSRQLNYRTCWTTQCYKRTLAIYPRVGRRRKHVHSLAMDVYRIVAHSLPRSVFTGPLPSNGCPSVVGDALVGTCLPSRCLAMVIYVTISIYQKLWKFLPHIKHKTVHKLVPVPVSTKPYLRSSLQASCTKIKYSAVPLSNC